MLTKFKRRVQSYIQYVVDRAVANAMPTRDTGSSTRHAREMVYVGDGRALTRTIYGHKMFVHTHDLSLAPHLLLDGYWERWITEVFLQEVIEGMVVVDIGANFGFYSLLACTNVGKTGNVISFEANPHMCRTLSQNIEINGFADRAKAVNKAVFSGEERLLDFVVFDQWQGGAAITLTESHSSDGSDGSSAQVRRHKVPSISLDAYFPPGSRVDFIKIDAEGSEPHILLGASRLLMENPEIKILMEWSPVLLQRYDIDFTQFCDFLRKAGFVAYRIEHDSTLVRQDFETISQSGHCDVLLKRHGEAMAIRG